MPCAQRISPSKVRSFWKETPRKGLHPLGLPALTNCSVMWNDLELYHDYRDFTVDPVKFSPNEMRDFIRNLVSRLVFI
jgi:hypothetical protein